MRAVHDGARALRAGGDGDEVVGVGEGRRDGLVDEHVEARLQQRRRQARVPGRLGAHDDEVDGAAQGLRGRGHVGDLGVRHSGALGDGARVAPHPAGRVRLLDDADELDAVVGAEDPQVVGRVAHGRRERDAQGRAHAATPVVA
nr:hypothetical protein [Cellulosimicrobium funkei]